MKNSLFLFFYLLSVTSSYAYKPIKGLHESEVLYAKGLPIPDEFVTPGITIDVLLEKESKAWTDEIEYLKNKSRGGDVYRVLDQIRRSKDYTQIEKLREFAEISRKKSLRYTNPDTYQSIKSLDWYHTYYETASVLMRNLEKIKAEDEAAGRVRKTPGADGEDAVQASGRTTYGDTTSGQNETPEGEQGSRIRVPWWLAGVLVLIIAGVWRILRKR